MNKLFRKQFIRQAKEKGYVADAVCIHVCKTLWSELWWDIPWLKTYRVEAMYEYVVNKKLYFKYIKFRLSKNNNEIRNPYKIRVYYNIINPQKSHWDTEEQ